MSTPAYAQASRALTLSGVVTRRDGVQVYLNMSNIVSYTVNDSISSSGIAIGAVCSASYSLSFRNPAHAYTPTQFDGAEVHMYLTKDNATNTVDFGVWYVDTSTMSEQSVTIDLSGADALKTRFNAEWKDAKGSYPCTIGSIFTALVRASGLMTDTLSFPNSTVSVSKLPTWGDNCTLRQALGYVAACAGGFAHVNRKGKIEILTYHNRAVWDIGPDFYTSFSLTGGQAFDFNCLQVKGAKDKKYTSYKVDTSITDNSTNCIQITDNPLYTSAIATTVKTNLALVPHLETGDVSWIGDPNIKVGDLYNITDTNNVTHTIMVLSQRFSFDGGLSVSESCTLPSINEPGDSYSTVGTIFDSNGNISATRITGMDTSVVNATYAHFNSLTAGDIKTDTLTAALIDALKLRAQQIEAGEVTTDSLTATIASIVNATVQNLSAGSVTADTLQAGFADIIALKALDITASNINTDLLGAQLARIGVLTAGSAEFDKATVKHLIANLLNVEDMVGGKVAISNLAVDYASMVTAYVGNLCVKGKDGKFYKLSVDSEGGVHPELVTVTDEEAAAGQTEAGQPIIESQMTVSDLTATSLKALEALITKLNAVTVDADTLIARQAFIDKLKTLQIIGDKTLQFQLQTANNVSRYMTFDDDTGLVQRVPDKVYYTRVGNDGFYVMSDEEYRPIAKMTAVDGITAQRLTLGSIRCKATSKGGWVWQNIEEDDG